MPSTVAFTLDYLGIVLFCNEGDNSTYGHIKALPISDIMRVTSVNGLELSYLVSSMTVYRNERHSNYFYNFTQKPHIY